MSTTRYQSPVVLSHRSLVNSELIHPWIWYIQHFILKNGFCLYKLYHSILHSYAITLLKIYDLARSRRMLIRMPTSKSWSGLIGIPIGSWLLPYFASGRGFRAAARRNVFATEARGERACLLISARPTTLPNSDACVRVGVYVASLTFYLPDKLHSRPFAVFHEQP